MMATAPAFDTNAITAWDGLDPVRGYDDLLNFLQNEDQSARDSTLDDRRASNIASYRGDPYAGDHHLRNDGLSTAMTRDVAEVADRMATGLLGTVMAGGKAVEFESEPEQIPVVGEDGQPVVGEDKQPAMRTVDYGRQATAAVQYQFFRRQPGYRVLHDSCKAGLLEITGIVRTYPEPQKAKRSTVIAPHLMIEGTEDEPTFEGQRVVSAEPAEDPDYDAMEEQAALDPFAEPLNPGARLHTIVYETPQPPIIREEAVPNGWFLVAPDTTDLDTAVYVGQCTPVTMSKLVGMGHDADRLKDIWGAAPAESVVDRARDADRSNSRQTVSRIGANKELWFHEEYPLFDLDGDGIAERLYVARIGREVLTVMPVDEQPYSGWCPFPMQHRFAGEAIADKVSDIQRLRTNLLRSALNSTNLSNMPRVLVNEDNSHPDTVDDLLNVAPGGLIRYKGAIPPMPLAMNDTSGSSFQAMEMISAERDRRTGITQQSQGMNPDSTNKTATGIAILQENADQIELYICRNFAEFLVGPMFAKRYRLMRAFMPPFRMKIDGEYQTIDPSKWPEDPDMLINVGLGTGTKDQRIGYLSQLLQIQQQIAQSEMRIVDEETVYNSVAQFIEDSGVGSPNRFIRDPRKLGPAPEQPDPEVAKAQADAQTQQAKDAQAHQQAMARLELQGREQDAGLNMKRAGLDAELEAKAVAAQREFEIKERQQEAEAALAVRQQQAQAGLALMELQERLRLDRMRDGVPDDDAPSVQTFREGGALNE